MAVFTAIASAIVTAIGVSTATIIGTVTWASLATSVIATGLAIGTAKLLGVFEPPSAAGGADPGVKIQLAPSTDNKVPRFYGRNYAGGMIIDAEIKNQNKTMAYAIVISEYNDADDNWSVNDIYRGDARLNFAGATVQSVTDANATASSKVQGKMRVRVYAGGAEASNQIFPVTDPQPAYGGPANGGTGQFTNWTAANTMTDLVFAIFELDYEPEEGLTGLGAITFDINNALTNPADVMLDYLTNDRYGGELTEDDLDLSTFTEWRDYCDVNVNYITQGNVTSLHNRFQIDGAVSAFNTVKDNINNICLCGGAFFTYNNKTGKFGVVVNRAAGVVELADAFVLDNDNIVSKLTFRSTDLFSLYNSIEVAYPSVNARDQTDIYIANVDPSLLNPNEPDNTLKYRLPHVNDRSRVATLANIDLNQSRLNTVIELTTDHSGMQIDVGDVIKLTEPLYGYNEKLFRVMRATELEDSEGTLTVKLVLLEYDSDVYGDLITQEDLDPLDSRITDWWVANSNTELVIGNVTIVNNPDAATANVHSPVSGSVIGTANMANVREDFASLYSGEGVFINVPIDIPANTTFNLAKVVCIKESTDANVNLNVAPVVFVQSPATAASGNSSMFENETTYDFGIDGFSFSRDTSFRMEISLEDTVSGSASRRFVTGSFQVSKSNIIKAPDMSPGSAGLFRSENLKNYQVDAANLTSVPSSVDSSTWTKMEVFTDNYLICDAAIEANVVVRKSPAYPEMINNWLHTSRCFFTGQPTDPTLTTTAFFMDVLVSYEGNVALDNGLTEGNNYVTTPLSNCDIMSELPVFNTGTSFFGTAGSTLLYNDNQAVVNGAVQPATLYLPFEVYNNKAVSISVRCRGVTSIESNFPAPEIQQRGFGIYQSLEVINKGELEPLSRTNYIDRWTDINCP